MKELVLDLSHWDEGIDLAAWKNQRGLWGVIIKVGGNETNLGRYRDPKFDIFYNTAKSLGLHVGFYYYTVTTDVANASADAKHMMQLVGDRSYDLPWYMDVEDPRQFKLSARQLTDVIKSFCNTLNSSGIYSGLYTGGSAWLNNMYPDELRNYANWIAWWRSAWPSEAGDIGMWQQGGIRLSDGHVIYDDKPGYHDCDWCVVDYPSRIKNKQISYQETVSNESKDTKKMINSSSSNKGTADEVIRVAEAELGYYAPSDPERGSKYGRWMAEITGEDWLAGPSTEIWWCCMFVSWVLNQAGVVVKGFPSQNTDLALNGGAKNYLITDKNKIRRGDILIFDWNWATTATDHIGFAKGSPSNGYVTTIEGNVGNSVQNKSRALSTIRYVVRPQYSGEVAQQTTNSIDISKNNRNGGKLDIDGVAGYNTIVDWQNQLGTPCDGEISGQYYPNRVYFPGVVNVTWEDCGSELVKAVQKKVGVYADGYWGMETSKAIQNWLLANKYDVGNAGADGYFGTDSVKALQLSLNDGVWKV